MPPIPIYSNAPINPQTTAAKADGITPQTATDEQLQPGPTPTRNAAVPTSSTNASSPPAPQPGARPIPPTQPAQPAPSSAAAYGGAPPPPQPGQASSAATAAPTPTLTATAIAKATGSITTAAPPPPPQFSIPPPTTNAAATHSTHASTTSLGTSSVSTNAAAAAAAGPTTLNMGPMTAAPPPPPSTLSQFAPASPAAAPGLSHASAALPTADVHAQAQDLSHPPGYVQNPYAADGTAAQRERLVAAAEERRFDGENEGVGSGLWGSVVAAASKVGEGLKRGEEEAWRLAAGKK
ncbi:hypothetical protein IWZ03DRAFT_365743 [Phyllosticta citriasiana]|uniref:Uncharacterized protein n=1 Tax=Phyllosticta citriasiana TaxID=595635 RepID=A0ABR1KYD2_9PEZI